MHSLPGTFQAGSPILAADFQALRAELQRLLQIRAEGLEAVWSDNGIVLRLLRDAGLMEWARITACSATGVSIAENVTYSVKSVDRPTVVLDNVYPAAGRPCANAQSFLARIYPAKVGALVAIVWVPQDDGTQKAELWFPGQGGDYEALAFKKCGAV